MHIAFVIPNLGPGGAERVASLLCNYWAAQGHSVSLVTFEAAHAEPFYALHYTIAVHRLEALGGQPRREPCCESRTADHGHRCSRGAPKPTRPGTTL